MTRFWLVPSALAIIAAGCGSSARQATPPTTTSAPPTTSAATTTPQTTTTSSSVGALQAEANATAAGDIPDNQMFLVFQNPAAGYSIKYPEGWAQQGAGANVSFRDKNNIVRIVVAAGPRFTPATVRADVRQLGGPAQGALQRLSVSGEPAFQTTYSSVSAPNAVTGKRVRLVVDRYYVWKGGHRAVVDLGTPIGVDNVDAYRLMIESFRWR